MMLFIILFSAARVFNSSETTSHDYLFIEFHCLLLAQQWGFDDSSQIFMRFNAPVLGSFKHCYGPMKRVNRFVNCCIHIKN